MTEHAYPEIKIIDFGLARQIKDGEQICLIVGTPEYVGKCCVFFFSGKSKFQFTWYMYCAVCLAFSKNFFHFSWDTVVLPNWKISMINRILWKVVHLYWYPFTHLQRWRERMWSKFSCLRKQPTGRDQKSYDQPSYRNQKSNTPSTKPVHIHIQWN